LLQELTEKRKDLGIKLEEEKKKQNNVRSQIQIMTSRQKMLIDMERNLEGYNRTVRVIFTRRAVSLMSLERAFMVRWLNCSQWTKGMRQR